jgi:hypothetical protein
VPSLLALNHPKSYTPNQEEGEAYSGLWDEVNLIILNLNPEP